MLWCLCWLFFNDTATTEIYTLSLHDALPIFIVLCSDGVSEYLSEQDMFRLLGEQELAQGASALVRAALARGSQDNCSARSEEHTSELQSRQYLVCRLLLEKINSELPVLACLDVLDAVVLVLVVF